MSLNSLFNPKSIAIYGVSTNPEKIGSIVFYNLISSEFEGEIYPINPKYEKISGYKCYKNVRSIKENVDLAIMAVPAEFALDILEDCHKKRVKNLVIISAGFSEAGDAGKILEEKLVFLAKKYDIEIFGPNSLGIIITKTNINASFAASNAIEGGIALMSQSGAVCTSILDYSNTIGVGFSHLLSIGNKSMINENHLLEYFLKDKQVNVIGAYLEEFANGKKFIHLKEELGIEKPIVVMSPGVTDAAKDAIKSHTGSLASSHNIINSALEKYGIISTDNLSEFFNLLIGFEWINTLPKGNRVGVITNAGGVGILATDALVESGLEIAKLSDETIEELQKFLPQEAHARNPIDVIGDAKADRYKNALHVLAQAEEVDSILILLTPQLVTEIEDTAKLINSEIKNINKPVIPVFIGGEYVQTGVNRLNNNKHLCFTDLNIAVYVLDKITEFSMYKKLNTSELKFTKKSSLKKYSSSELSPLPEEVVQKLIEEFDFSVPETLLTDSSLEAVEFANQINYPVVIKATTESITHKTDEKAIFLNINNNETLAKNCTRLQRTIMEVSQSHRAEFLVQKQIKADLEVFIGIKRDDSFGYIMLFGTGGIYTEVYKDISQRLLPLDELSLYELIESTKVSQVINGARGQGHLAKNELVKTLLKLQEMVLTYPEIAEVDINPAMLTADSCLLADVKIFTRL